MAPSPFDRLRTRLQETDLECRQCGYECDEWQATTSGGRVQYRLVCPVCGAIETRELRL